MHVAYLELAAPVHVQDRLREADQRRLLRAAQREQPRLGVGRLAAARLGALLVRLGSHLQAAEPSRGAAPAPAGPAALPAGAAIA